MTDKLTMSMECISYARILLDVDVSKPLVRTVSIIDARGIPFDQEILFEYEPDYCSSCHTIGHATSFCKRAPAHDLVKVPANLALVVAPISAPTHYFAPISTPVQAAIPAPAPSALGIASVLAQPIQSPIPISAQSKLAPALVLATQPECVPLIDTSPATLEGPNQLINPVVSA